MERTLETIKQQVNTANYRARALGLSDTLTIDQWLTILNHWHWRCAICGKSTCELSPDHWIPLCVKECPGSTFDNIVPLCEPCNLGKNRTEPKTWLLKTYSDTETAEKLGKIRSAIQKLQSSPLDTQIPELHSITVVFDMALQPEADMWRDWEDNLEVFPIWVKNNLYTTFFGFEKLIYLYKKITTQHSVVNRE